MTTALTTDEQPNRRKFTHFRLVAGGSRGSLWLQTFSQRRSSTTHKRWGNTYFSLLTWLLPDDRRQVLLACVTGALIHLILHCYHDAHMSKMVNELWSRGAWSSHVYKTSIEKAKQMERTICCDSIEGNGVSLYCVVTATVISLFGFLMVCSISL